jgi:hypothetical protein
MTITTKDGKSIKYYPIVSFRDKSPIPLKDRIMAHINSVEKNKEIDYIINGYQVEGGEVWQRNA